MLEDIVTLIFLSTKETLSGALAFPLLIMTDTFFTLRLLFPCSP